MTFDKLVYRETVSSTQPIPNETPPGNVLTVDFGGIGELTLKSGFSGEVNWRRITRHVLNVLRSMLDACDFEAWRDDYTASATDKSDWGLELFDGGKPVKRIRGGDAVPEQWPAFRSILELCGALAEDRSKRMGRIRGGSAGSRSGPEKLPER